MNDINQAPNNKPLQVVGKVINIAEKMYIDNH